MVRTSNHLGLFGALIFALRLILSSQTALKVRNDLSYSQMIG